MMRLMMAVMMFAMLLAGCQASPVEGTASQSFEVDNTWLGCNSACNGAYNRDLGRCPQGAAGNGCRDDADEDFQECNEWCDIYYNCHELTFPGGGHGPDTGTWHPRYLTCD